MTKLTALWNPMADDSQPAGWISTDAINLSNLIRQGIQPTPLLVCAGGTSSRCAADGLWTLDLRARHRQLIISEEGDEVEIGAGLTMAEVLSGLQIHGRSIPVGLSTADAFRCYLLFQRLQDWSALKGQRCRRFPRHLEAPRCDPWQGPVIGSEVQFHPSKQSHSLELWKGQRGSSVHEFVDRLTPRPW